MFVNYYSNLLYFINCNQVIEISIISSSQSRLVQSLLILFQTSSIFFLFKNIIYNNLHSVETTYQTNFILFSYVELTNVSRIDGKLGMDFN